MAGVGWGQIAQDLPCQAKKFRSGQVELESHEGFFAVNRVKQVTVCSLTRKLAD
jgi:hypothetical protein